MKQRTPIEWDCPDNGETDSIVEHLAQRYLEMANAPDVPIDDRECKYGGYVSFYGKFERGFRYRLGIAETRPWHGKDVCIKGFAPEEPRNMRFSIIICFFAQPEPLQALDSA